MGPNTALRTTVAALVAGATAVAAAAVAPASATTAFSPVRMVVGAAYTDPSGKVWKSETGAVGGRTASTTKGIAGTTADVLYQRERYGMSGWNIRVGGPGTYRVVLRVAENYWGARGKRVFDVKAEGRTVLGNVDIFARAGGKYRAHNLSFNVVVNDGTLNLGFVHRVNWAKVGSLQVSQVVTATPTSTTTPTAAATPTATVTPTAGTPSTWSAPSLVDPLVWVPSATSRNFRAPADRDVLVKWPTTPLDVPGGFQLSGGRNVVSQGGIVQFSQHYPVPNEPHKNRNRCFYLTGNGTPQPARTVHIEGLRCAGQYVWEGINVDSKAERGSLTVQLRNIRIDKINVTLPGELGSHEGGDAFQTWNGPHRLRIDGFTAKNLTYQGFFLQPYAFGSGALGEWDFNRVQLQGADAGHGYLLWLAANRTPGTSGYVPMTLRETYVIPGAADTRSTTLRSASIWPDVSSTPLPADFVQ